MEKEQRIRLVLKAQSHLHIFKMSSHRILKIMLTKTIGRRKRRGIDLRRLILPIGKGCQEIKRNAPPNLLIS